MDTDRNLLFGVLAMQADVITSGQFVEVCTLWASNKSQSLAELLEQRGWITGEDRQHVEYLLGRKLAKHQGDVRASLAEVGGEHLRQSLVLVPDRSIQQTLAELPPATASVNRTVLHETQSRERYTLTHLHARGGIGQVWLARDETLGREVALKELRPERADSQTASARFLEEARITGQLEHPGIVPVYELAQHPEDGQPFYTMRMIRGRTLSEAIEAYHEKRRKKTSQMIELRELLTTFVAVSQTVAYVHARGVIHRDLKGQNVILGDFGEVIVLDWGLAKVLAPGEANAGSVAFTVLGDAPVAVDGEGERAGTLQGQVLGTPAYMAPEQAAGRLDLVDRRTDVYGLGAMLYEILTGVPPFTGTETHEVLRRVMQEQPTRPGEKVKETPAALEAICLKALAKQPEQRYRSAGELAREVQRWLADESVSAYRDPWTTRLTRWGRRHRTLAASAGVLLMALVTGLSVGTVLLGQANRRTQEQRNEAERQRDLAQENFETARRAVDDYFTTVSENKLLQSGQPGLQPLRKELLESALKYYQEFVKRRADDPEVKADLGQAYFRVGMISRETGALPQALVAFEKAREVYATLGKAKPSELPYQNRLAKTFRQIGIVSAYLGKTTEAGPFFQKAIELGENLVKADPNNLEYREDLAWSLNNLAITETNMGKTLPGLKTHEQVNHIWKGICALKPGVDRFELGLAESWNNLGVVQKVAGRVPAALQSMDQAIALEQKLIQAHPTNTDYKGRILQCYGFKGHLHAILGEQARAREAFHQAIEILGKPLAQANPSLPEIRYGLAEAYCYRGEWETNAGKPEVGLASFQEGLKLSQDIDRDHGDYYENKSRIVFAFLGMARAQLKLGKGKDAREFLRQARERGDQISDVDPKHIYTMARVAALGFTLSSSANPKLTPQERSASHRQAEEAVHLLRRAVASGWYDVLSISRESDFDALRSRADFQAIIREAGRKAKGE